MCSIRSAGLVQRIWTPARLSLQEGKQHSVTVTNKDMISSATGNQDRIYFTKWWYVSGALVTGRRTHERFTALRPAAEPRAIKSRLVEYFESLKVSTNFRKPTWLQGNCDLKQPYLCLPHILLFSVDWENTLRCLLISIEGWRTPNRRYCTPLADSSPLLTWRLRVRFHSRHLGHTRPVQQWPEVTSPLSLTNYGLRAPVKAGGLWFVKEAGPRPGRDRAAGRTCFPPEKAVQSHTVSTERKELGERTGFPTLN